MSPLSRRFLATAAAFLGGGLALGLWLLIGRELRGIWPSPLLVSAHTHLLVVGTILSTILGTALWLFPRPLKNDPRVRAWHGEAAVDGFPSTELSPPEPLIPLTPAASAPRIDMRG